jgi:hypothetical protein
MLGDKASPGSLARIREGSLIGVRSNSAIPDRTRRCCRLPPTIGEPPVRKSWLILAILVSALHIPASAQSFQLLPELDVYYKLNPDLRVYFQAKETREGGAPTTAEIGPSLDVYLKKLSKLVDVTAFGRDDSKSQMLVFSIGYRYLPTPNEAPTNRMEPYVVLNIPTKGRLLISDRNRADLDWKSSNFSWHYRNRVTIERPLSIRTYHVSPYASAEFWYTSQYAKWSTTSIFAGCLFPLGKHVDFNLYYEHENNTGKSPNQQLNQLGTMLNLWF